MCQNKLRNARILLKKILKVIFRLPLLSTGLSLRFFAKMKKKNRGAQALRALDPSHKVRRGLAVPYGSSRRIIWASDALFRLTGACGALCGSRGPLYGVYLCTYMYYVFTSRE